MNRLKPHERSFELIRFCSKTGITVAGGLSRLLKHFVNEKKAGDIMTYVDKQLSDGTSFINAGFKKHGELPPTTYLVDKKTFDRIALEKGEDVFDKTHYYKGKTGGNLKLVFNPNTI